MKLLLTYIFLLLTIYLYGQKNISTDFYHLQLDKDGGITQNSVSWIATDSTGQMWFATKNGVIRYNAKEFFIYKHIADDDNSIDDNFVTCVFVAKNGDVWVATQRGIKKYNPTRDNFDKPISPQVEDALVTNITQDKQGNLWFNDYRHNNLFKYSEQNNILKKYHYSDSTNAKLLYFIITNNDEIFITTNQNFILKFNKTSEKFEKIILINNDEAKKLPRLKSYLTRMTQTSDGNIWIGSNYGFFIIFNPENYKTERFYYEKNLKNKHIYLMSVMEDKDKNIWFGTWFNGLYKLSPDRHKLQHFLPDENNQNSLSNNIITCIYQDKAGYMWFGSEFAGVNILKKNKKFYTLSSKTAPLPALPFLCAVTDDSNKVWLGTDMAGLLWFDNGDFQHPHKFNFGNFKDQRIFSIIKTHNGNIIAGTENGIVEINPYSLKVIKTYTHKKNNYNSLSGKNIISLCEDKQNNIWAGSIFRGLTKINSAENKFYRFVYDEENKTGISDNYIISLYCDASNNIWIATLNGLDKFDTQTGTFTLFKNIPGDTTSISANRLNCLYGDGQNIWIGTEGGGICRYSLSDKKFHRITKKDGLPSDYVRAIITYKDELWFSTTHNICKMNLKDGSIVTYGASDGLQSSLYIKDYGLQKLEFIENFAHKDSKGYLYFGGIGGFYVFNPDSLPQNTYKPKLLIDKFTANGKTNNIPNDNLILKPNENNIEISFCVLNFIQPEKNKLSYFLEGYDTTYHTTQNFTVKYFNLPSGKYILHYKGANNDGFWSDEKILHFEILPHFYQTTLFYILIVIALLLMIAFLFLYKSNLTEKQINRIDYDMIEILTAKKLYLDSNLSLQKLADAIKTKPNYLSQVINTKHNCNFREFVNKYRIEEAKRLLKETDMKIEAIAYEAGFNTLSTFNTVFKKETGQTPSFYRKNN